MWATEAGSAVEGAGVFAAADVVEGVASCRRLGHAQALEWRKWVG